MSFVLNSNSMSGYNYNFAIVSGSKMELASGSPNNYAFTYIDFSQVELQNFNTDPFDNSSYFIKIMQGKQSLIYVPTRLKNYKGIDLSMFNYSLQGPILNNADLVKYKSYPNAIQTKVGSIIAQPFVPSINYIPNHSMRQDGTPVYVSPSYESPAPSYFNGLSGYNVTSNLSINCHDKSQSVLSKFLPYNWLALKAVVNEQHIKNYSNSYAANISGKKSLFLTYGERNPQFNYITNKGRNIKGIDTGEIDDDRYDVIADRQYVCNIMSDYSGSFAFCYDYGEFTPFSKTRYNGQKEKAPMLVLNCSMLVYSGKHHLSRVESNFDFNLVIPPDGQITATLGSDCTAQGGFGTPSNDLLPPQCRKVNGKLTMNPLFIYPIYSGMVITNSLIKNAQNSSEQIFVKFPEKSDFRFETKIIGEMNDEIKDMCDGVDSSTNLKWFPAVLKQAYQTETTTNNGSSSTTIIHGSAIKPDKQGLSLRSNFRVNFNYKGLTLQCIRSLCSFAYCPLFFAKSLAFTLFFKGVNKSTDNGKLTSDLIGTTSNLKFNTNFHYYFYPIVYDANIYDADNSTYWSKGLEMVSGISVAKAFSVDNNSTVYDSSRQETIYRADFLFCAEKSLRYPLQVLGAVCVFERLQQPINVANNNGDFIFSSFNVYSYISSNVKIINDSNTFFDFITGCSLQFAQDGVTGSLNLDCFPLSSGLDNVLIPQSIGQLDLNVVFYNESKTLVDSSLTNSFNPNPDIFKGFALQI